MSVIAFLPKVWLGTIAEGKHTAVTGYLGVGANVNLSRNAFVFITRHTYTNKLHIELASPSSKSDLSMGEPLD